MRHYGTREKTSRLRAQQCTSRDRHICLEASAETKRRVVVVVVVSERDGHLLSPLERQVDNQIRQAHRRAQKQNHRGGFVLLVAQVRVLVFSGARGKLREPRRVRARVFKSSANAEKLRSGRSGVRL